MLLQCCRLEKALAGTLFTAQELSQIEAFMKMARTEAESTDSEATPQSLSELPRQPCCAVGAVMVDPVLGAVVGRGHTDASHPLKHAAMLCIDAVAHGQGGGAWGEGKPPSLLQAKYRAPEFPQLISCEPYTRGGDDGGSREEEEEEEAGGDRLGGGGEVAQTEGGAAAVSSSSLLRAAPEGEEPPPAKRVKEGQYICTGYHFYTTREPCTM